MTASLLTLQDRLRGTDTAKLAWLLQAPPELVTRLRGCARTQPGLDQAAARRLGSLPSDLSASQSHILSLGLKGLRDLALLSGTVRHARAVLRLVDGAALRRFVDSVHPSARDVAVRRHALVAQAPELPQEDDLAGAVARDGWLCLRSWSEAQPAAIGTRILLMTPSTTQADTEEAGLGTRIVEALAGDPDE